MNDCEAFHRGLLEQPVNAWSSLTLVAAGLLIALEVRRRRLRAEALVFAASVSVAGVGSFLFHGIPSERTRWLHDVSLLVLLGIIVGAHLEHALGKPMRPLRTAALTFSSTGLLLVWAPESTNALVAAGVTVIVVAEIIGRRRGRASFVGSWTIVLIAVGLAAYLLGRTGAPLCDPDAEVQLHGVWHAAVAVVTVLWAQRAFSTDQPD